MRRVSVGLAAAVLVLGLFAGARNLTSRPSDVTDFVHFESGHVHPVAMTPSGHRLLVVNTPDNRLSVFDLTGTLPVRIAEIPVGLEPVSVAARTDDEAWVVNHLSDDVSIVNLTTGNVRATVRVGDEPSDVVFANGSAYVSVSQEDAVKVVDPGLLGVVNTIPIDGRMPRALVATADGARVYAAVFNAGNRTSIINAPDVGNLAYSPFSPSLQGGLGPLPIPIALIVKQDNTGALNAPWRDELGRIWGPASSPVGPPRATYNLFDVDVAQISTATQAVTDTFSDIGTLNFGLAVSGTGNVVVTATEARNLVRLEPNLRGHLVKTRAAVIHPAGSVTPVDLNPGINYSVTPGPSSDLNQAIGIPTGVAWAADGASFYVTALANDRIARVSSAGAILARGKTVAGPTGVVVDGARGRLYVVGRFRNQVETLDAANFGPMAVSAIGMDPTPDAIVNGRKFFYGGFTSGHGEQACATCHVFGDMDNVAWDLGDPLADSMAINTAGQLIPLIDPKVHPVKGPMATQSLRGLPNTGMLHWRADRQNLSAFNPAFVGLMGRAAQLPDSEMAAFNDFVLPLVYPPNPRQNLDRSFKDAPLHLPSARRGRQFFFNRPSVGQATCNTCHSGLSFGPGTNGQIIHNQALLESQDMKVPQLRNLYKKTGFLDQPGAVNKRGFGFTHDGAVDNLFNFLHFPGFNFADPPPAIQTPDENRRDVEAFLLAFDTGMAPAVGHQITFKGSNNGDPTLISQLQTLRTQFDSTFIDLIAKGRIVNAQNPAGIPRGWIYLGADQWRPDRGAEAPITSLALRSLGGAGTEVTITGVPRGSGQRMGIDRDRDGHLDGDEVAAGSDPGNPASTPANVGVESGETRSGPRTVRPNPFQSSTDIAFALARPGAVECVVHDLFGRQIRVLARGLQLEAGAHRLHWNGRRDDGGEVPAGVYFVRLRTAQGSSTHALVRIR